MDLMTEADDVVRAILPAALDAAGRSGEAGRLRRLPRLRDPGSVSMACGAMRAVRPYLVSPDLGEAVRLCEEAVLAAVCGDASGFGRYVREAAGRIRGAGGLRAPAN